MAAPSKTREREARDGQQELEPAWEDLARRIAHERLEFSRDQWRQLVVELDNYDLAYDVWFRAMHLVDEEEGL